MGENGISPAKVISDLEHARLAALKKNDLTNAIAASKLQGSYLSMFSERFVLDTEQIPELDHARLVQCRQIASYLIETQRSDDDPARLPSPEETVVEFTEDENQ